MEHLSTTESAGTLYFKVKHEILSMLKELPVGSRIPTRNELASNFQVARPTIDRAISELMGEGYLVAKVGSGTYVVSHDPEGVRYSAGKSLFGILLPSVTNYSFPELIRGAEDVCNGANASLILCNTDNSVEKQNRYIDKLLELGASGMIVIPALDDSFAAQRRFAELVERGIKVVFCTRGVDSVNAPKIATNDFYAADMAVSHIVDMGWTRPAFISERFFQTVEWRYAGYMSALYKFGITYDESLVCLECDPKDGRSAFDVAWDMLRSQMPPDAFFCFNDATAIKVYRAIEKAGLKIGEDIAVVGCDDTIVCDDLAPGLTSVCLPTYEIGRKAAASLLKMLHNPDAKVCQTMILEPILTVRESSGRGKKL